MDQQDKTDLIFIGGIILVVSSLCAGVYFYKFGNKDFKLITDEAEMTQFIQTSTDEQIGNYYRKIDELKRQDSFGGKTPEETLRLFVEALKVGDLELASKYFVLEDQSGKLDELKSLDEQKIKEYLEILETNGDISCSDVSDDCELRGVYKEADILITRFEKVEQSGLWKLKRL